MDVRDVQHPGGRGVRLVGGEGGCRVVELGDVGDQPRQLLLVDVELGGDAACVAHHRGGARQQPGELRLQHRFRVPGERRGRAAGHQQREGEPACRESPAGPAVDGEGQRAGAGQHRDRRAYAEVERARADVVRDLVLQALDPLRVVHQGRGALLVEFVDVDVQPQRRRVAVQRQRSQRCDIDLGAAAEGGAQRHRRVDGSHRLPHAAHGEQPQPGPQQRHEHQPRGTPVGAPGGGGEPVGEPVGDLSEPFLRDPRRFGDNAGHVVAYAPCGASYAASGPGARRPGASCGRLRDRFRRNLVRVLLPGWGGRGSTMVTCWR